MEPPDLHRSIAPLFNHVDLSAARAQAKRTFRARCHCGQIQYILTLPEACLPLRSYICHCGVCRRGTGSFGSFLALLPPGMQPVWLEGCGREGLTAYARPGGVGQTLFCSACGSRVGFMGSPSGQFGVNTSLFDDKFWRLQYHVFPRSAPDGGMIDWLPDDMIHYDDDGRGGGGDGGLVMGDGPVVPDPRDVVPAPPPRQGGGGGGGGGGGFANVHVHLGPAATTTPSSSSSSLLSPPSRSSNVQQQDRLRAECFCGSVSFAIPRPTAKVLADPILKQCVPPGTDGRRWKAYLDASRDSCRLGGTGVMPWVLVPRMALEPHIGPELRLGSGPSGSSSSPSSSSAAAAAASSSSWGAATLRTYKPSPQVTRAFCAKCGAAVFNKVNTSSTDEDTMVLGVAAGILCAPGGAVKALDWVQWRREVRGVTQSPGQGRGQGQGQGQGGRPSAASRNSNDPEFIASLSAGYKAWLNAEYGGL